MNSVRRNVPPGWRSDLNAYWLHHGLRDSVPAAPLCMAPGPCFLATKALENELSAAQCTPRVALRSQCVLASSWTARLRAGGTTLHGAWSLFLSDESVGK